MSTAEGSSCSTPQRSCSGDDSDSDYENENIRPRGLTGLQNLGNTCYLNSALQSLSNCPPLTRYFLDCAALIRPEKPPMLARSYLKLIAELWHKKRPSYVVPSGVVSGIKAVHPMFRGYTQQDAQEFLRCLMDQLHEELKVPSSDDSDYEEEEDSDDTNRENNDDSNNANNSEEALADQKSAIGNRRPSFDSQSSQSELDYETCDSGLSSERSSNGERDNGSSDENNSDGNEVSKFRRSEWTRKSSLPGSAACDAIDSVANTKEMKETANLLEKKSESETQGRRPPRNRAVMEGGDSREQGHSSSCLPAPVKDSEGQAPNVQPLVASVPHPAVQPQQQQHQSLPKSPVNKSVKTRKVRNTRYDSIISQTFDGKILSSVRCLNCETVSTTKETFQDLSLPIPSKDHLHMLHSGHPVVGGVNPPKGGTCGEVHQGWLAWMFSWMKSWFIGPTITLQDCLSAFFSADELKGDNMYSCEKCKKLRNGLKYSKVLELPEILSIHLKRFRHEFYSSKIGTYISFPMEGLDMEPYLHKDSSSRLKYLRACKNEVTLYDLIAIICHHGTAGGGHYTAYCLNHLNEQWYEFDDQYVTEVDISQVQNCEAYVLFYRKNNRKIDSLRQRLNELERSEPSILRFYISRQWMSRFQTFAEPGHITNKDFLCKHGGVPPGKVPLIGDLVIEIHQTTWELLYNRFGGGPVCNHLYVCKACQSELEKLRQRQRNEKDNFIQLNEEFQAEEHSATVYAISMAWFKEWEAFVKEKTDIPPGPIENSRITLYKNGQPTLRQTSDYGQLSKDMWLFLHRLYGGGPELIIRQSSGAAVKPMSSSPTPQQNYANGASAPMATTSSSSLTSSSPMSQTASVATSHSSLPLSSISAPSPDIALQSTSGMTLPQQSLSCPAQIYAPSACSAGVCDCKNVECSGVCDSLAVSSTCSAEQDGSSPEETTLNQESSGQGHQQRPTNVNENGSDEASQESNPSQPSFQNTSTTIEENIMTHVSSSGSGTAVQPVYQSPLSRVPNVVPSMSVPTSFMTLPLLQANPSLSETSGVSLLNQSVQNEEVLFQAEASSTGLDSPSPSAREDLKTSVESLPDSGVGTDYSCSSGDLSSLPGSLVRQGSEQADEEARTDKKTTHALEFMEDGDVSVKFKTPKEPKHSPVLQQNVESKQATNQASVNSNTGKGKKRNKKAKNMDVTRI